MVGEGRSGLLALVRPKGAAGWRPWRDRHQAGHRCRSAGHGGCAARGVGGCLRPRGRPGRRSGKRRRRSCGPRSRRRCRAAGCLRRGTGRSAAGRRRNEAGQAGGRCGTVCVQGGHPVGVCQQGRRVAAADHPDRTDLVGYLDDEGSNEVFTGLLAGLGDLGQVSADAVLQRGGRLRQGGAPVGGFPEGAEYCGGVVDRGQALAPDVADQKAGRAAGTDVSLGRPVRRGNLQRAHPVR